MGEGIAVVTGASSGIGAAAARELATAGFEVVLGARRLDRLQALAEECGGRALMLDVTDAASVEAFASELDHVRLLVNNAGLAIGLERVDEVDDDNAQTMWHTNVMGVLRMTRSLLPSIEASGGGHIVNVGSVSGFETYPGGAVYTATKHAVRAITRTLRLELVGRPIKVTEVNPGHVASEFSLVRFEGDERKVAKMYEGFEPLQPQDVAEAIVWAATRPANVNIDEIVMRPLAQASAGVIARSTPVAESP